MGNRDYRSNRDYGDNRHSIGIVGIAVVIIGILG